MKAFWWQGGIHLEPETPEEGRAMRLLYDSVKRTSIGAEGKSSEPKSIDSGCGSSARLREQLVEDTIANE